MAVFGDPFSEPSDHDEVPEALGAIYSSVLYDAKVKLTNDSFLAVVSLRAEQGMLLALEQLLLAGQLDAELGPDADRDRLHRADDFTFHGVSDAEQAERRKSAPRQPLLVRVFFAPLNLLNWLSRVLL